jgi:hypothetical protein
MYIKQSKNKTSPALINASLQFVKAIKKVNKQQKNKKINK